MTKETNPEAFNAKAQELRLCISYVNLTCHGKGVCFE